MRVCGFLALSGDIDAFAWLSERFQNVPSNPPLFDELTPLERSRRKETGQ
jgi:hypothetical protein